MTALGNDGENSLNYQ